MATKGKTLFYHDGKPETAEERAARLEKELNDLKAKNGSGPRPTTLRVSEKGGLSVYGLGRFPITYYREQWEKLLDMSDEIRQFIKDNDAKLKRKEA